MTTLTLHTSRAADTVQLLAALVQHDKYKLHICLWLDTVMQGQIPLPVIVRELGFALRAVTIGPHVLTCTDDGHVMYAPDGGGDAVEFDLRERSRCAPVVITSLKYDPAMEFQIVYRG